MKQPTIANKKVTRYILQRFGIHMSKRLGQNFLIDANIVQGIVDAANVQENDRVLEIGPGIGTLTQALAETGAEVTCVELDKRLPEVLAHTLDAYDNVRVIQGDILKVNIPEIMGDKPFKVVANLPYYITTPILLKVLEETTRIDKMIVMMQTEVAKRLCGKPSTKDYNALSVLIQYFTNPRIIFNVSPKSFFPEPNVESSVVMIEKKEEPLLEVENLDFFLKFNRNIFAQRRKTLYNNIQKAYNYDKGLIKKIIKENNLDESVRSEELDVSQIVKLANDFYING